MKKSIFIILLGTLGLLYGQDVNVPNDYWGYSLLERLEVKGLFISPAYYVRPLSRPVFAQMIAQIIDQANHNPGLLSHVDDRLISQLAGDFYEELRILEGNDVKLEQKERHLYHWQEENSRFWLDCYGGQHIDVEEKERHTRNHMTSTTRAGFIIRGDLQKQISFNLNYYNSAQKGSGLTRQKDLNFNASKGLPINITGSTVYQDNALAYFCMKKKWLRLEMGKDEFSWGPAYFGQLGVSANMPPADLFRVNAGFNKWNFTFIQLFLSSGIGNKYLSGHRIDYQVNRSIHWGLYETAIYNSIRREGLFAVPVLPFPLVQSLNKSSARPSIGMDFSTSLMDLAKLYFDLFFYDWTTNDYPLNDKLGATMGCLMYEPFNLNNVEIRMEYTRLQSRVYASRDSNQAYTHYNYIIGHWLGPNTAAAFLQMDWAPFKEIGFKIAVEKIGKGQGLSKEEVNKETGVEKQGLVNYTMGINSQIYRDVFLSFSWSHSIKDGQSVDPFPSIPRNLLQFKFYFNY